MSNYKILPYSYKRAEELGVKISPSRNPKKKIDIFDWNCQYICSIGQAGAMDFPQYLKKCGYDYAMERRRLYLIRHRHEREILGSPSFYSKRILW